MSVPGIPGPYCAYGVEKRFRELDGVKRVDLLWEEETIRAELVEGAAITREQIMEAMKKADYPYEYDDFSISRRGRGIERQAYAADTGHERENSRNCPQISLHFPILEESVISPNVRNHACTTARAHTTSSDVRKTSGSFVRFVSMSQISLVTSHGVPALNRKR